MDVIMSIRPEYVRLMATGEKTIEIRTRRPNLQADDIIWVYEKLPVGHVSLRGVVGRVETLGREVAWRRHKAGIGIDRSTYSAYLDCARMVSLIIFKSIHVLQRPVSLRQLRSVNSKFCPPQFMAKVEKPAVARALGSSI